MGSNSTLYGQCWIQGKISGGCKISMWGASGENINESTWNSSSQAKNFENSMVLQEKRAVLELYCFILQLNWSYFDFSTGVQNFAEGVQLSQGVQIFYVIQFAVLINLFSVFLIGIIIILVKKRNHSVESENLPLVNRSKMTWTTSEEHIYSNME